MEKKDEIEKEEEKWRKEKEDLLEKAVLLLCRKYREIIEAKGWTGKVNEGILWKQLDAYSKRNNHKESIRFFYPRDRSVRIEDRLFSYEINSSNHSLGPTVGVILIGRVEDELKRFCDKLADET